MKIREIFESESNYEDYSKLEQSLLVENIRRGRYLALFIILFDSIIATIDIASLLMHVDDRFHYLMYLVMYALMIAANILFMLHTKALTKETAWTNKRIHRVSAWILFYITFVMCWGSVVSLLDQALYGQLMVFMVNMISCSSIYFISGRKMGIPYLSSSLILLLGLPFFQSSTDILIGHYVNVPVIVAISLISSRMIYKNYCANFKSKLMLEKANILLEREIEQNKEKSIELSKANQHLRKLSVVDELTGLSNRRGFQSYIDRAWEDYAKGETMFSCIMMDIDHFKIYNDTYGHVAGDKVMQAVANQISVLLKNPMHYAARWGGEEFIYIAFHTGEEEIEQIAEEIRAGVEALKIPHEYCIEQKILTISLGIYTKKISGKTEIKQCIEEADRALYQAKSTGRNQVKKCMPAVN